MWDRWDALTNLKLRKRQLPEIKKSEVTVISVLLGTKRLKRKLPILGKV